MRSTQQFSVTLPIEMAQMVKAKVASGDYASESEVMKWTRAAGPLGPVS